MESARENLCSVIQYFKGPNTETINSEILLSKKFETQISVENDIKKNLSENINDNKLFTKEKNAIHDIQHAEAEAKDLNVTTIKTDNLECQFLNLESTGNVFKSEDKILNKRFLEINSTLNESDAEEALVKSFRPKSVIWENNYSDIKIKEGECKTKDESFDSLKNLSETSNKGKKKTTSEANADTESVTASVASAEEAEANEDDLESDFDDDEEGEYKPRKRGRCKKNPDIIPPHLSSDMVLGYKILLKFLETPQFAGFHKPFKKNIESDKNSKITCLNQIKKKFEENSYKKLREFVNDVREMLINIYESRNQVAIKKALRLEQILEQRIAQLPNYLRPQCALILSSDEVNNCHNKIRITKGGGFVSLLLEKTEKKRYEKNREKRKLLAEERKQLKEEQDKDVQEWEKNILLKDCEEDIKSMWELPAIGHFIHLCADIFNIGEVTQFEVERMLLMPQCSDTLDLIMTALLTNSLVRAKLDRTPSMPYSIWGPLVRTRVMSWYRMWHRDGKNEQKIFEEIGIEPEFWQILGPEVNPLDYYYFHETSLLQRVWILKTLCDVDFVRKKTVYDNIRAQTLDELNPIHLGLDHQGNRYIQFKQFCGSDIRIYRQSTKLEGDIMPSELIESFEGFEFREGPITVEKVFKDIWELNEKPEIKTRKKRMSKSKRVKSFNLKVNVEPLEKKNLRQSAREKQKIYVDWSDSDQSDTDLRTLRNKLLKSDSLYRPFSDKEFISLSVFRLPREKVNKPTPKRTSYASRRTDDASRIENDKTIKTEPVDKKDDVKPSVCEDEHSDSLDTKHTQNMSTDFEKTFQGDDMNEDEFDIRDKIKCELDNTEVKFTVTNLENLKMVFKKGSSLGEEESEVNISGAVEDSKSNENVGTRDKEYDTLYKHSVPDHLKPDSSKFYLVVDSVEGLRQLISKFGSHENDLEIITRSTKSQRKKSSCQSNMSCEVQLIERLQNLLLELEPWELDLMKSSRLNKEKMYKEYMSFLNRPPDFVHPNEAYWMKTYEEPNPTTSSATTTTTTVTTTTADNNTSNCNKTNKDCCASAGESAEVSQQDSSLDTLGLRKRTRVTRLQLQPESDDFGEDFDDGEDYESNESDENWVLPTPKKRSKKETANRTPKSSKRSVGRRAKSSPFEKTDSQTNSGEKSQNLFADKAKKALFWGPRSSDPSEDLNWETNRQKILEQHNSPIKKLLKSDESVSDLSELENTRKSTQKQDSSSQSVPRSSPKRLTASIPGNKKPYFSSAQTKPVETVTKKSETEETQPKFFSTKTTNSKPEVRTTGSNTSPDCSFLNNENKTPVKIHTYSRVKKAVPVRSPGDSSQTGNRVTEQPSRQPVSVATSANSQVVRYGSQICSVTSGGGTEETSVGQVQIQQSVIARPQQIQIQDVGQNRVITSVANVRIQQPVQWQQKVINVQPVDQSVEIGQQVQTQTSTQNQNQVQGQPQKVTAVPQSGKLENYLQMVTTQGQPLTLTPDSNLYITDGKNLMKFDNSFVQHLQKDKVLALDVKKTLLLLKPRAEGSQSTSQNQTPIPTSQQNILVINKPTAVQQTISSPSVSNFVIPTNYIIKDGNQQGQAEQGQQTVKIVQQSPAYVIQQNKSLQPQVIKIITSQPMATNQNLIFTPVGGQMIQSVTQTSATSQQPTKPTQTLRLVRPHIASSVGSNPTQNKVNSVQSPIIVNNIVQIQGQRLETPKPQTSVVSGRIVSTGVPAVRMASPQTILSSPQSVTPVKTMKSAQPQTVLDSENITQGARSNVITQSVRLATVTQDQVTSINTNPRFVVTTTHGLRMNVTAQSQKQNSMNVNQTQSLRFVTSPHQIAVSSSSNNPQIVKTTGVNTQQVRPQTVIQSANPQIVSPTSTLNTQTVRLVSQPQLVQTSSLVASANVTPAIAGSSGNLNTQTVKLVQPQQYQTQTVVPCMNLNTQTVRLATGINSQPIRFMQSQPVRLIANNSVGVKFINRNSTPIKAAVITSAAQTPVVGIPNVQPSGMVCQPVQYQTVVQPAGLRTVQNAVQLTPSKKPVNAGTIVNAPILIVEDKKEEKAEEPEENVTETPVTFDYINGELSVKKTSQGWKYAVKASNGKDIILTDEQIEERLKANNGVMK